jgi:hypothetical protein
LSSKDRRAQLLLHLLVLLDELEIGALLPRIVAGLRQHGLRHFGIRHRHFGLAAHFGQHEAKANPALGQRLVLIRGINGTMVMTMLFRMLFMPQLMRDLRSLGLHQTRRQVELHHRIQLIQQRPLQHGARRALVFGFQTLRDLALQRGQILGPVFLGQLIINLPALLPSPP